MGYQYADELISCSSRRMSTSAITRIFRRHQKIPADIFVKLKADFYVVAISFYQKISLNHQISDTVWLAQ